MANSNHEFMSPGSLQPQQGEHPPLRAKRQQWVERGLVAIAARCL
jgi:hypothetical protein